MPKYAYTAVDPGSGREHQGTLASATPWLAAAELKSRGLAPTSLVLDLPERPATATPDSRSESVESSEVRPPAAAKRRLVVIGRVISRQGLTLFTRQLAILLKAGMPLMRALEVLARPERNAAFKEVLLGLAEAIRAGDNLSDGLRRFPRVFNELYLTMVKAGEAGGVLDTVLDRLARFLERNERIRGRVKAAMTYPVIIMTVAGGIQTGLMVFVVPKFQQIFSGVLKGQPLPPLTRLVIGAGEFIHHHLVLAMGLLGLVQVAWWWFRRSRNGTRLTDWLFIKSPVTGDLVLKAAIARFTRTFGSLLASGVPILEALMITRAASGNVHVAEALGAVHDRVKAGGTVTRALEATALFPGLVTSMIEVGEETGALPGMLGRIADTYDEEVDQAVAALTSLIEPIMIVLMALVVGVIVIALFLPMVSIVQHLQ